MGNWYWSLATIFVAGCVLAPSGGASFGLTGSGPGASSAAAGRAGQITVPPLFGLSREQAIAALRRAGYQGEPTDDSSLCGSVVEGRVIELGQVCYQHPAPGQVQGARLPISIRVQRENPWYGNTGRATEWRLMPTLTGMSVQQARARLEQVGFARKDLVRVVWVEEQGCRPLVVCRTEPARLERAGVNSEMLVFAGRDPDAKASAPAIADAPPPSAPPPPVPPAQPKQSNLGDLF